MSRNNSLTIRELVEGLDIRRWSGTLDERPADLTYDSRLARPGSLFVALRGGYVDGHDYLDDALERGASLALVESWSDEIERYTAAVQVPDTRAALPLIAARYFGAPADAMGMIGVTGTDGKTTTSYLIDAVLRANGLRTGLIGTVAVRIADQIVDHDTRQTTPESLEIQRLLADMRDAGVGWAVLEATSHGLALHRLDYCPFDIAVVTNITHEHLDFHGSISAYRAAKARLLERVGQGADRPWPRGVVLNADDEGARSVAASAGSAPVVWYGVANKAADIRGENIEFTPEVTRFDLVLPHGSAAVTLRLVGPFNVENALAAAGAAYLAGLAPDEIARGLESLSSVPGRLTSIDEGQPFSVYVDYAHTPDSLEKMLRLIRSLVPGRVISVFGSAGERDRAKRPRQGAVAAALTDFTVFTSEDPRFEDPDAIIEQIAEGAESAGAVRGRDFVAIEDRRAAIHEAISRARPGDAVLLAGKGHETCIIYGAERRPWNEAEEARLALRGLGFLGGRGSDGNGRND